MSGQTAETGQDRSPGPAGGSKESDPKHVPAILHRIRSGRGQSVRRYILGIRSGKHCRGSGLDRRTDLRSDNVHRCRNKRGCDHDGILRIGSGKT